MQIIQGNNVNEIYPLGLMYMANPNFAMKQESRYGDTLEALTPVATVTYHPRERVLFDSARNANPFFHLIEAIWILAGRRDVATLEKVLPRMAEFSDDREVFHAAYGYRLIQPIDQIWLALHELRKNPDSRRVVLQIWDKMLDLNVPSRDIPCNDLVFLKIREGRLHARVMCRSNDMLWGAYGANIVQFSMLQEFMANLLEVDVGTLTQYSDSFHVYTSGAGGALWDKVKDTYRRPEIDPYSLQGLGIKIFPRIVDTGVSRWRAEADDLLNRFCSGTVTLQPIYANKFFNEVVSPMMKAFLEKDEKYLGRTWDWHVAGRQWLARRSARTPA